MNSPNGIPRKRPPKDLKAAGRKLWQDVIGQGYRLDPAEVVVLHQLARTVDVLARISAELDTMSIVVAGSEKQPVVNKLCHEMREQGKVLDVLQRALALPLPGEAQGQRRSGDSKRAARAGRPRKINPNRLAHFQTQEGA
jgi:hypothetical protein